MIPEFQIMLKNELNLIKAQLSTQTKVFESLSHSITLLEHESRQQQGRIAQLEEVLRLATSSPHGSALESLMQKRVQELWKAMSVEVQGLQGSMSRKESSMENLSQEVLVSKKFLWEELEAVQAELRRIHQKLKDQDVNITKNLVCIKKMQETQGRGTKFLAQVQSRLSGGTSETGDLEPRGDDSGDKDVWSSVNTRRSYLTSSSSSIWGDKRGPLRVKNRGSHRHRTDSSSGPCLSDSALR